MSKTAVAPAPLNTRTAAKPADHPKYVAMVDAAIRSMKDRRGSSRQAILKYIMANYKVGDEVTKINARIKTALKWGVTDGTLKQTKGTGANGSFVMIVKKVAADKPKPKKVMKSKTAITKKPKSPKKAATKKVAAAKPKKATTPKKVAAAKPKKAKSPAKKAAKPKAAKPKTAKPKTPKKASAKKPAVKKAAKQ